MAFTNIYIDIPKHTDYIDVIAYNKKDKKIKAYTIELFYSVLEEIEDYFLRLDVPQTTEIVTLSYVQLVYSGKATFYNILKVEDIHKFEFGQWR